MDILQKLLDSGATVDFRDRVRPDPAPGSMPARAPRHGTAGATAVLGSPQWSSAVPTAEVAMGRALLAQPGHWD